MHSSEVKEDTHDSFRRITAEVICAGEMNCGFVLRLPLYSGKCRCGFIGTG